MKTRIKLQSTLAILGIAAAGFVMFEGACNSSANCETLCSEAEKCTGAPQRDCPTYCKNLEASIAAAGCQSSYNDDLSCLGGVKDVCTDHSCDSKGSAVAACVLAYCLSHSNDPNCKAPGG